MRSGSVSKGLSALLDRASQRKANSGKFQFSLRTLLMGMCLFAVVLGLCIWRFRSAVYVTKPLASDEVCDHYFGFQSAEILYKLAPNDIDTKEVAVVKGHIWCNTCLDVDLYLVQSGVVSRGNSVSVGRSSSRISPGRLENVSVRVALGESKTSRGDLTVVGCSGLGAGAGGGAPILHNIQRRSAQTFRGRLTPGEHRIVYVEGDALPVVSPRMSIHDFARNNKGAYLVVVLELR